MKELLFLILISIFSSIGFSQTNYSTKSKKAIKYYEEAQLLLRQRRFNEAIRTLQSALEKDHNFIEAHLRLAFSYELLRELKAQQYHLEQVVRIAPDAKKYKNVYYSLGKLYFNKGEYNHSKAMLSKLEELGIDNVRIQSDVDQLTKNLDFAIENIKSPIAIDPKPMPQILNSFPLQYFPVLTADENTIILKRCFQSWRN